MTDVNHWIELATPWAMRIVFALVIFIVGRWVAKLLTRLLERFLERGGLEDIVVNALGKMAYVALLVAVVLAALAQLGVNTASALAVFGAAGLAVGLALKDSLGNFASGVMLIAFRPFSTGHYVEVAGTAGTVQEVSLFTTVLLTPDNRRVIIPNSLVSNDTIINYSAEKTRRCDVTFGIGYDDDIRKAVELINSAMASDDRILKNPEAAVVVTELADSSVNLAARPWVASGDYWPVRADLLERVKKAFDDNGISIPYPQQDVHMHNVQPA